MFFDRRNLLKALGMFTGGLFLPRATEAAAASSITVIPPTPSESVPLLPENLSDLFRQTDMAAARNAACAINARLHEMLVAELSRKGIRVTVVGASALGQFIEPSTKLIRLLSMDYRWDVDDISIDRLPPVPSEVTRTSTICSPAKTYLVRNGFKAIMAEFPEIVRNMASEAAEIIREAGNAQSVYVTSPTLFMERRAYFCNCFIHMIVAT